MTLFISILLAVGLDYWLGEPCAKYHPLVGFGKWAQWIERRLHAERTPLRQRAVGILAWTSVVMPCWVGLFLLPEWPALQFVAGVVILYFCIAARSLELHAWAVHSALRAGDLPLARQKVGFIVSRNTESMAEADVRRAAVESVLENGADAVFAPLFWFAVLGPGGALLYRLSNTLDAMWGYKNQRYLYFGWAAARIDDVLNWLPARLTALSYALLGNTGRALRAWKTQAHLLDSPNAGPVMTAGGGALQLQLGGPAVYHGQIKHKPWFGGERIPQDRDIVRAWRLMYRTLFFWLIVIGLGDYFA